MKTRMYAGGMGVSLFLAVYFAWAGAALRVDENAMRLRQHDTFYTVGLPVQNPSLQRIAATARIELLDEHGNVIASGSSMPALHPGQNHLALPLLAQSNNSATNNGKFLSYRVRYAVTAKDPAQEMGAAEGIVSVGQITPDVFVLEAAQPRKLWRSDTVMLRVRAVHPVTRQPMPGVSIEGKIEADWQDDADEEESSAAKRKKDPYRKREVTDRTGYAAFQFELPKPVKSGDVDWSLTGTHAGFKNELTGTVEVAPRLQFLLLTDKPIYQPGQSLRVRALAADTEQHAMAGAEFDVQIQDPENAVVFRTSLTADEYGIAHTHWKIPERARLGNYAIEAGAEDMGESRRQIKISRYDLPAFTVQTQTDKAFYLPGENAGIEVRGAYLFGKPVAGGKVRVVREKHREWNYRQQKWDVDEGGSYEASADASGMVKISLSLEEFHKDLADHRYDQFRDLTFGAYLTDPSTGRSEEKQFDVRITRSPIHVYIADRGTSVPAGVPLEFYVTASYADGRPAKCALDVRETREDKEWNARHPQPLRVVETNRFGVARVTVPLPADPDEQGHYFIEVSARDREGKAGKTTASFYVSPSPRIVLRTNKAIYAPGEPVEVTLESNLGNQRVYVDLTSGGQHWGGQAITLGKGRGFLIFPSSALWKGEATVTAIALGISRAVEWDESGVTASRNILFPARRDLNVQIAPAKGEYRPGEKALVNLRVRSTGTGSLRSALGVVVYDQAVEERARADREFGRSGVGQGFRETVELFRDGGDSLAGIRRMDLNRVDPLNVPEGMDLVAEVLFSRSYTEEIGFESDGDGPRPAVLFSAAIEKTLGPVKDAFAASFAKSWEFPRDDVSLRRLLKEYALDAQKLRDPWGHLYRASFGISGKYSMLEWLSDGPDKRPDTEDDFVAQHHQWPWFQKVGRTLDRAVVEQYMRTGGHIRSLPQLVSEMERLGVDWNTVRDPHGNAPQAVFSVQETRFVIGVWFPADGDSRHGFDLNVWTSEMHYAVGLSEKLEKALAQYGAKITRFPETAAEFFEAVNAGGVSESELTDPWGNLYRVSLNSRPLFDYQIRDPHFSEGRSDGRPKNSWVHLHSNGPDGREGTADDFIAVRIMRIGIERGGWGELKPSEPGDDIAAIFLGAIRGTVTDATGAVITGADVRATDLATGFRSMAKTNELGEYRLSLHPGFYELELFSPGFKAFVHSNVQVRASRVTRLDARLEVGTVTCLVTVEASAEVLQSATTTLSLTSRYALDVGRIKPKQAISTPRLREYFPETLLWLPDLRTDARGRARVEVPLADSITTWKIAVVASDKEGQLGVSEETIRAFQPLFVEHDPPKVLTEGDVIHLPVLVRNYLEKPARVALSMKPDAWFELTSAAEKTVTAAPNDATREVFTFRATHGIASGKQRVTAAGADAGDGIERSVTVHPDGEERHTGTGHLMGESQVLRIEIPSAAIPGSVTGELKIYPNPMTHVLESIEGIMQRPNGCGEQTISSTYPHLLLLQYLEHSGLKSEREAEAQRNLKNGYERLLTYRTAKGGFAYWKNQEPDLALSAYALQFLADARSFTEVDSDVIDSLRAFLLAEMRMGNHWSRGGTSSAELAARGLALTAHIAHILAQEVRARKSEQAAQLRATLHRVLDFLHPQLQSSKEPYLLAAFALTAQSIGDARSAEAVAVLKSIAYVDNSGAHWELAGYTPFHSWGRAGTIETTGLVLQALAGEKNPEIEPLRNQGFAYLLGTKDQHGVWHSTQATIAALRGIVKVSATTANAPAEVRVVVNGEDTGTVEIPNTRGLAALILKDVSALLHAGSNEVQLVRTGGAPLATAHLLARFYVPWQAQQAAPDSAQMRVNFSETEVRAGDPVQCTVTIRRSMRSYGMYVAEVGLPPGAEVDRTSLEKLLKESSAVDQYDVLPDRVVLYLWQWAGETQFHFAFRARYALTAKSAASLVYDYYNPDARATAPPALFHVRDQ